MKYIISIILLALFVLSVSSYAESDYASGTSALSSSASINFVIKIPQSMYVRIGDDLKTSNMRTEENSGQLSARVLGNSGTVLYHLSRGVGGLKTIAASYTRDTFYVGLLSVKLTFR
jgi:hypothetical protein